MDIVKEIKNGLLKDEKLKKIFIIEALERDIDCVKDDFAEYYIGSDYYSVFTKDEYDSSKGNCIFEDLDKEEVASLVLNFAISRYYSKELIDSNNKIRTSLPDGAICVIIGYGEERAMVIDDKKLEVLINDDNAFPNILDNYIDRYIDETNDDLEDLKKNELEAIVKVICKLQEEA